MLSKSEKKKRPSLSPPLRKEEALPLHFCVPQKGHVHSADFKPQAPHFDSICPHRQIFLL